MNFRSILGPDVCGRVNEVALFSEISEPTTELPATQIIALFEETEEWWDQDQELRISERSEDVDLARALIGDTFAYPNIELRDANAVFATANSYIYDFADMDISTYSPGDTIQLLVSADRNSKINDSLLKSQVEARITLYDGSGQSISIVLGGSGDTQTGKKKTFKSVPSPDRTRATFSKKIVRIKRDLGQHF